MPLKFLGEQKFLSEILFLLNFDKRAYLFVPINAFVFDTVPFFLTEISKSTVFQKKAYRMY